MLDQLKAMGALAGIMKNRDKLQSSMQEVKDQMAKTEVTGRAGGGAATARVNGKLEVLSVEISPALLNGMVADAKTRQQASTLIAEAVNDGIRQAQEKLHEAVQKKTRELGLPDIPGLGGLFG
ncbi:MAG: YbaB/EbfC family nucleoid-associated protein [Phycisphaerales bacterium]|nr:YbaB/EbfC family nucleoid-associated protein [Planctomycetota bacterium]